MKNKYEMTLMERMEELVEETERRGVEKVDGLFVTGSYVGDGRQSPRFIDLGFTPRAVLLIRKDGMTRLDYDYGGGLALPTMPIYTHGIDGTPIVSITEGGFTVDGTVTGVANYVNMNRYVFVYLAIR